MNDVAALYAIDKSVPLPLYSQLKARILGQIAAGTLKPGDLLPSESQFCRALGISRPTIRQAFSELAMEGYVAKQRGRGSFVSQPKIEGRFLSKLQSFDAEMRQQRLTPSTRLISLEQVPGIPAVNDRLGLPLGAPLIALTRLRAADGIPVVYVETYLPHAPFAGLLDADLEGRSLYATLEEDYGVRVDRVTRTIEAVQATPSEADLLEIRHGAAISLVHTVAYASRPGPVEYSVARYRGDRTTFSLELYR